VDWRSARAQGAKATSSQKSQPSLRQSAPRAMGWASSSKAQGLGLDHRAKAVATQGALLLQVKPDFVEFGLFDIVPKQRFVRLFLVPGCAA
jgi:hypothetical protein